MQNTNRLKQLTQEQERVSNCQDRIISLRGYHGTGKTKTTCFSIVDKLARGNDTRFLALSLTKKAASKLRMELTKHPEWRPNFNSRVRVGTFHSFAHSYVRRFADRIGFTANFEIDNGINEKLLRELVTKKKYATLKDPFKLLMKANRKHIRSGKSVAEMAKDVASDKKARKLVIEAVGKLVQWKRKRNVMDFDDLIFNFYRLLVKDTKVVNQILSQYSHLVVDEFQDTTGIQWRITKLLIQAGIHFLGAGDPYQTIHRHAGASLKRFNHLEGLKGCKAFELTENHRSTKQVVAFANALLGQYSKDLSDKVWAKKTGPEPEVYLSQYRPLLYRAILKLIRRHLKQGVGLNEMAVVARFDRDLEKFMPALKRDKVPFVFYSKNAKEAPAAYRIFKAILWIAIGYGGSKSWQTILPFLGGVGEKSVKAILNILKANRYRYKSLLDYAAVHRKSDLEGLLKLIGEMQKHADNPIKLAQETLSFLRQLRKKIKDLELHSKMFTEIASESENIDDLLLSFHDNSFGQYHNFKGRYKPEKELTLANIHQIKGHEFKVVFLLGSLDYNFKSYKTFESRLKIIDELFVMITGVSRTERNLYLLLPMAHDEWKDRRHNRNPSIFIRNCPAKLYHAYSVDESPRKSK